eukprot:COSAG03_NODE_702_length_6198_cov_2.313658_1_plen_406_part_00
MNYRARVQVEAQLFRVVHLLHKGKKRANLWYVVVLVRSVGDVPSRLCDEATQAVSLCRPDEDELRQRIMWMVMPVVGRVCEVLIVVNGADESQEPAQRFAVPGLVACVCRFWYKEARLVPRAHFVRDARNLSGRSLSGKLQLMLLLISLATLLACNNHRTLKLVTLLLLPLHALHVTVVLRRLEPLDQSLCSRKLFLQELFPLQRVSQLLLEILNFLLQSLYLGLIYHSLCLDHNLCFVHDFLRRLDRRLPKPSSSQCGLQLLIQPTQSCRLSLGLCKSSHELSHTCSKCTQRVIVIRGLQCCLFRRGRKSIVGFLQRSGQPVDFLEQLLDTLLKCLVLRPRSRNFSRVIWGWRWRDRNSSSACSNGPCSCVRSILGGLCRCCFCRSQPLAQRVHLCLCCGQCFL